MGGVLVDIHPDRVFQHWSDATGRKVEHFSEQWSVESEFKLYETGKISFAVYTAFLERLFKLQMSQDDWRIGWNALVGDCFDEVFAQVQRLATKMQVYCFTNSNPEHESVWANEHLEELTVFTKIFNSSTIGYRKPDQEAFEFVLQLMDVEPRQCFFIDDLVRNVEAARKLGMQAVHTDGPQSTTRAVASLIKGVDGA